MNLLCPGHPQNFYPVPESGINSAQRVYKPLQSEERSVLTVFFFFFFCMLMLCYQGPCRFWRDCPSQV